MKFYYIFCNMLAAHGDINAFNPTTHNSDRKEGFIYKALKYYSLVF